jgi:polysaccharide transporter, PST family
MRHHLRFVRDTIVIQTLNYVASNADNVFIGRSLGSAALGQYNRAYNLASLPASQLAIPLEQVILPRLSAALGTDFDATLVRCQQVMLYALLVPLSIVAGTAYPLVYVCLGSQWQHVPELMQIQAIGQGFSAVGYIYWWSFLVKRRTGVMVFGEGVVEVLMVVVIAFVVKDGSPTVAWCVAAGQMCMTLASTVVARRVLDLDALALLRVALPPVLTLTAAALGADQIARAGWSSPVLALLAASLAWTAVSASGYVLLPQIRRDLQEVVRLLRSAREGR